MSNRETTYKFLVSKMFPTVPTQLYLLVMWAYTERIYYWWDRYIAGPSASNGNNLLDCVEVQLQPALSKEKYSPGKTNW